MPSFLMANDIMFNRLNRLYNQNLSRCLEVSKRYIELFPEQPSPYYFAAISYRDKSEVSKTIRGRYINLNRCVGYAVKFEETDNEDIVEQILWKDVKEDIEVRALDVISELQSENQFGMSKLLSIRLAGLSGENDIPVFEDRTVPVIADNKLEADMSAEEIIYVKPGSNVKFYGLPSGREVVSSSDLVGEREVLRLVHEDRAKKGQKPLVWDEDLARAARYHSYDLATQNYFNHSSYDRKNGKLVKVGGTFERIQKFYSKSFVNSENIAAGNKDASTTYQQWYNSRGHYDNMFNPESGKVGIGVYYDPNSPFGYYWTFCTAK
jgi:uncharacterized protein YkwD